MNLNLDNFLVSNKMILNGASIRKRIRHTMNNVVNLTPNRGTLASTDHTSVVGLCGH